MSKAILESNVLRPRHPSLDDNTDEWPEFTLTNVHVHTPGDPAATASLLEASAGYPVTVTGQLEPLDDDDAHLYLHPLTTTRPKIVLENVYTFSYGQYGDGSTAIWAAGKAGWFTLKPGRSYKPQYNAMVEAVKVLYFIADSYREPRRKGKGKNAGILPDYTAYEIFEKYAAEELGSSVAANGQAKIYEHKEFLIQSMLSGKEGLPWSKYPLCKHLVYTKFPDITNKIRKRLAKPVASVEQIGKAIPSISRQTRQASVETTISSSSSRRKPSQAPRQPTDTVSIDSNAETSTATKKSLWSTAKRDEKVSRSRAAPGNTRSTRQTPIDTLEEHSEETAEDELATPIKDDETDEETRGRVRKNKSSLRPKANKGSKSAARAGDKGPARDSLDATDEDESPSSPTSGKRKYLGQAESRRPSKRRSSKTHVDEGIDMPTSSPSASEDGGDGSSTEALGGHSELALRNLAHVPDPLQEDTWICALDGCSHKVYAASHPDSQKLIKEHYALHAYDDDERVKMVKKLQAPSLPAGHLMERIKQQAKMDGFPGSRQMASRYPLTMPGASVVQRY